MAYLREEINSVCWFLPLQEVLGYDTSHIDLWALCSDQIYFYPYQLL